MPGSRATPVEAFVGAGVAVVGWWMIGIWTVPAGTLLLLFAAMRACLRPSSGLRWPASLMGLLPLGVIAVLYLVRAGSELLPMAPHPFRDAAAALGITFSFIQSHALACFCLHGHPDTRRGDHRWLYGGLGSLASSSLGLWLLLDDPGNLLAGLWG